MQHLIVARVTSIVIFVTIVSVQVAPPTQTAVMYVMFQAAPIASLMEGVNVMTIGDVIKIHPLTFLHISEEYTADSVGITV